MSKTKTFYQCQSCAYASPKWIGKCPDCGSWNSFVEEKAVIQSRNAPSLQAYGKPEAVFLHSIEGADEDRANLLARGALMAAAMEKLSVVSPEHVRVAATEII